MAAILQTSKRFLLSLWQFANEYPDQMETNWERATCTHNIIMKVFFNTKLHLWHITGGHIDLHNVSDC